MTPMNYLALNTDMRSEMQASISELRKAIVAPGYVPNLPKWVSDGIGGAKAFGVSHEMKNAGVEKLVDCAMKGILSTVHYIRDIRPSEPPLLYLPPYRAHFEETEAIISRLVQVAKGVQREFKKDALISDLMRQKIDPSYLFADLLEQEAGAVVDAISSYLRFLYACAEIDKNEDRMNGLRAQMEKISTVPHLETLPHEAEYNTRFFAERHGIASGTVQYHFGEFQGKKGRSVVSKDRGTRWRIFDYDTAVKFDNYLRLNRRKKKN
jgi:hypothetical protein